MPHAAAVRIIYRLTGPDARVRAEHLCVEQTIEFPLDLVTDDFVREHVVAQVVAWEELPEQ